MKLAVAGAGAVGRSVTRELVGNDHDVTLIERNPDHVDVDAIPAAHWRLGDACELSLLESVHLHEFDVVVAATGDDKANVVLSLLAKTEFAVPRVVARVNDPRNEWLFPFAGAGPISSRSRGRTTRHGAESRCASYSCRATSRW